MPDERCGFNTQAASFMVRITFCQNASYQGEITWLEGEKTRYFRSALELMTLLQEAVQECDGPSAERQLRTWREEDEPEHLKTDTRRPDCG